MGRITLSCSLQNGSEDVQITTTRSEVERMASDLKSVFAINYVRDRQAPIEAGELIATMTYKSSVYNLTASRTVEQRENVPKTLEQIISETYADPNPFPPFGFELAAILFGPPLLLISLIAFLVYRRRKKGKRQMRAPRPVNRYVK